MIINQFFLTIKNSMKNLNIANFTGLSEIDLVEQQLTFGGDKQGGIAASLGVALVGTTMLAIAVTPVGAVCLILGFGGVLRELADN
jgi:hypothetical protein